MSSQRFILALFFSLFCANSNAQKIASFDKYEDLEKSIITNENTIYVINFWATWCAPCVKELPHFEKLNAENKNVKVILVSLDFKDQFETKLLPFLEKKNIKSEVVFLADKNYNDWLPKVDKDWSGSIPATWLVHGNKKLFAERDFENFAELNNYVNNFINQ